MINQKIHVFLTLKGPLGHICPTVLHRNCTGPAQDLYRPCTVLVRAPHGSCTVPVPNLCCHDMSYIRNLHGHPHGPCTRSVQGLHSSCTGPAQDLYRARTGPVRFCTFLRRGYRPTSVNNPDVEYCRVVLESLEVTSKSPQRNVY